MDFILLIVLIVIIIELFILRKRVAKLEQLHLEKETKETDAAQPAAPEPWRKSTSKQTAAESKLPLSSRVSSQSAGKTQAGDADGSTEDKTPGGKKQIKRPVFTTPEETALSRNAAQLGNFVRSFFTSGNVVLKVGIVILFFGVSFLLKYAAQRNMIPIEVRLAGVALGGIALLATGWFLARKRPPFGLTLQGGGIGILYLTVFAAARLYDLLPNTFSFFVLFGLVVLSAILAVLQDARALAAFGASGGFLAPVLMSTGTGSHVMLFSYYALLNCGIVGISWFKAWRELNLLGFLFTFVISAMWGYRYYQPEFFATTEPFLLLFFLFYIVISILFAHRQPMQLRGFIDGPLVFGLPIVFFGMQASLVENLEYGVAFSALGLGAFYMITATLLWNRMVDGMRILTEAFLALAVVFGSLAIPFALDGHATASAWALEGGAMVWVGVRQNRVLARNFGILLQLGAALAYMLSPIYLRADFMFLVNELTLGGIFIAVGALFSSFQLSRNHTLLRKWEKLFHLILLGWGILWWLVVCIRDIEYFFSYPLDKDIVLLFFSFTALLLTAMKRYLRWSELRFPLLGFLPLIVLGALAEYNVSSNMIFLDGSGAVAWLTVLLTSWLILWQAETAWGKNILKWYHMFSLWLLIFILTNDFSELAGRVVSGGKIWEFVCLAIMPALFVIVLPGIGQALAWPVAKHRRSYCDHGLYAPLCFLVFWSFLANFMAGDPLPLPYIPLLNPLTLVQILVFLVIIFWLKHNRKEPGTLYSQIPLPYLWAGFGGLIFLWLNGITARLIHLYFAVPFNPQSLYDSLIMQSAVSILWSTLALTVTIWANRRGNRQAWFGGAVLLAGVVLKLFLIDLSGTGTIARIVSFLAVGVLMLLIGYFSPLPPKREEGAT